MQSQTAASTYLQREQIQPFGFALRAALMRPITTSEQESSAGNGAISEAMRAGSCLIDVGNQLGPV